MDTAIDQLKTKISNFRYGKAKQRSIHPVVPRTELECSYRIIQSLLYCLTKPKIYGYMEGKECFYKRKYSVLISSYWTRKGTIWTQTLQVVHGVVKRGKKVMTPFTLYSSSEHRNSYFRCKPLIHQNIKVDHSRFWTRSYFCRGHLSWSVRPWQNLWS